MLSNIFTSKHNQDLVANTKPKEKCVLVALTIAEVAIDCFELIIYISFKHTPMKTKSTLYIIHKYMQR